MWKRMHSLFLGSVTESAVCLCRWACYTVQIGKGSAVLYVEAETPFPSKAPRLSLQVLHHSSFL